MRVATDSEGYVTLRLKNYPNTAFDVDIDDFSDEDDWSGTEVTLTRVDPRHDPLLEPSSLPDEVEARFHEQIDDLVRSLGRDPRVGRRAMALDHASKLAVVEEAQKARVAAIAAKFSNQVTTRKAG